MKSNPTSFSDNRSKVDRGAHEAKAHHKHIKESDVLKVAETKVVSVRPTSSVLESARLMRQHDFRRLPVTDAGTNRLLGLVTAISILDFLGGGPKYRIIEEDYRGNFLSAINAPITKIMSEASFVTRKESVSDVIRFIVTKHTSCLPVVDSVESMRVEAIVTERDILPSGEDFGVTVGDVMNTKLIEATPGMMLSDVSRVMVRNGLRRLPVIQECRLTGIVTVFDVLKFLEKGNFRGVNAEENLSTRVSEVMSEPVTVSPDDDLSVVPRLIHETGFGGFPVVEEENVLGIVTSTDVLKWVYLQS
ncbi:Inosine-5'-monophosphate dehydrogenase [uncultured archaeon]|nr:Inosine-5'-monophosphate dehydrogenase [uncultured archaeon]